MATPASINRLTEHAKRAGKLMLDTDKVAVQAEPILDAYEATLTRFKAGLSQVSANEKALAAVLQGMGNATEIIDGAFQDEKALAAKPSVVEQQPDVVVLWLDRLGVPGGFLPDVDPNIVYPASAPWTVAPVRPKEPTEPPAVKLPPAPKLADIIAATAAQAGLPPKPIAGYETAHSTALKHGEG